MKQRQIVNVLLAGGRIVNHILLKPDGTPYRCRISDRQITALEQKNLVTKTTGYDRTRTWKLKTASVLQHKGRSPHEDANQRQTS